MTANRAALLPALVILFLASVAALVIAGVSSADTNTAPYKTYVACGRQASSPPAHSCVIGQGEEPGAYFESPEADVQYDVCVAFPTGKSICAESQQAAAETLYVNAITSNIPGKHVVTWSVGGTSIAEWTFEMESPPPLAPAPEPAPPEVGGGAVKTPEETCPPPKVVGSCAHEYGAGIDGIHLGDTLGRVIRRLGQPQRIGKGNEGRLCPIPLGRHPRLRVPVFHLAFRGHVTVTAQRLSRSRNICQAAERPRTPLVSEIATTSHHDDFVNGVRIGTRVPHLLQAMRRFQMLCSWSDGQLHRDGQCSFSVRRRPPWNKDNDLTAYLAIKIHQGRVRKIVLRLLALGA